MIGEPNEMISHLNPNNKFTSCQRILRRKNSKPFREIQLESLFVPPISNAPLKPMTSLAGRLVIIEGNIGVGKTTLAKTLSTELSCKVFVEPATENPYLEKFYKQPNKFALALQLWILQQRYHTYVIATKHVLNTGEGAILDRSVFSDIVFANVCHREGYITDDGYKKYMYWRDRALQYLPIPHITLFLNATPNCCHKRIHNRGRECEGSVPIDYLTKLHEEYLQFCEDMKRLGSSLVQYDWCQFHPTAKVKNEILEKFETKWNFQSIEDFTQRHSDNTELFPPSELEKTIV